MYYTNCQNEDSLITFEWTRSAIDTTVEEISETIRKIENRDFEGDVTNSYACTFCDMRYVCKKADI